MSDRDGGDGRVTLEALFLAATERTGPERDRFLTSAVGDHPEHAARLRELVAAHEALATAHADEFGFLDSLDAARAAALLDIEEPDLEPGASIGRFEIVRALGQGAMGVVYLARDPGLDREIALKLLPAHRSLDPQANERLVHEARAASSLDNPHIATVHEIGEHTDGRIYIAMAHCPGGTLRDRLAAGPLPASEAVRIAVQLADGLAAAHSRGVVHRDVKPENIAFAGDGSVRILDFGIAVTQRPGVESGAGTGTVAYMSPEQARGEPTDARGDLWAVGVVLYEMLTGERPFRGETREALVSRILDMEPVPLEGTDDAPDAVCEVVRGCLAKAAADRFQSAEELSRALHGALEKPDGMGQPRATRGWRSLRNRGRVGAMLAVVAAVALAVVVLEVPGLTGWAEDASAGPGRLVVADFTGPIDDPDLARALREALLVDLQQSNALMVVDRQRVSAALALMGLPDTTRLDAPTAAAVASRVGAGAVLSAEISRLGTGFLLSGRAIDAETGAELVAARASAAPDALLEAVEQLSHELRRRLGEETAAIRRSRPLPEVSTSSLSALKLYAEAERMLRVDPAAAGGFAAEAIRADPDFAMAHRLAAAAATGELLLGVARHHLTRAYELRDRLTERERWHVEALYLTLEMEPTGATAAYRRILQRYPDDWRAAYNLGVVLQGWIGDHAGAYESFRLAADLDPDNPLVRTNGVFAAFIAGSIDDADEAARRAEAAGVSLSTEWRIGRSLGIGDFQDAIAACDSLLASTVYRPAFADDREMCGSIDISAGRLDAGVERLEGAERRQRETRRYRNVAHAGQSIALAEVFRGRPDLAADRLALTLERIPSDSIHEPDRFITRTNLQMQAALLRRWDLVEAIGDRYPPYEADHWFGRAGEALLAAARLIETRDGNAALERLRAGWPPDREAIGWRVWYELLSGVAHDIEGRPAAAARHYRAAADPRFQPLDYLIKNRLYLPVALHLLARSEAAAGDEAAAELATRRLEQLLATADPTVSIEHIQAAIALRYSGEPPDR